MRSESVPVRTGPQGWVQVQATPGMAVEADGCEATLPDFDADLEYVELGEIECESGRSEP
ncbi:hypothetical protein CKO28_24135 [Rhodovibrio sodomensis]|uniref:Uncharacterized protein n=1 Tax=Rhodovibrio sodomensis TaxID=1088 RepID=A0ABS1DKQ0_9PROT|nr:hypothetical protein [Rhodovibrio sodomensis]